MASIGISVENDLYSIGLDQYEWTSLTVDGKDIPHDNGFSWSQTQKGPVKFVAKANLAIVNPNSFLVLNGTNTLHIAKLEFSGPAGDITLKGELTNFEGYVDAGDGPIGFSQGGMTGVFSAA